MAKYTEMTDFEKTVAAVAGRIFVVDMARALAMDANGEGVDTQEIMTEAVIDATMLVETVLEGTRPPRRTE